MLGDAGAIGWLPLVPCWGKLVSSSSVGSGVMNTYNFSGNPEGEAGTGAGNGAGIGNGAAPMSRPSAQAAQQSGVGGQPQGRGQGQSQAGYFSDGEKTVVIPNAFAQTAETRRSIFPNQPDTGMYPPVQPQPQRAEGYYRNPETYIVTLPAKAEPEVIYRNDGRSLVKEDDPTPIVLKYRGGEMILTRDALSLHRVGDSVQRHGGDYVRVPIASLCGTEVLTGADKNGNPLAAVSLDVVLPDGQHNVPAVTVEDALKDPWSFEVGNAGEARAFCAKVTERIKGDRLPMDTLPEMATNKSLPWLVSGWVFAVVFVVALTLVCFFGHPFSGMATPSEQDQQRIEQQAYDDAKREADVELQKKQEQAQAEADKKAQEQQAQQQQQAEDQQNAAMNSAVTTANSIIATSQPMSRQALIDQLVAQGIATDVATGAVDSLGINWAQNATELGRAYLQQNTSWTSDDLVSQLVNNDHFTQDEANTAVSNLQSVLDENAAGSAGKTAGDLLDKAGEGIENLLGGLTK